MKIVIIGDGKVGHKLTTQLSEEDYDITLIDQNAGKLKAALNNLDIFCINGMVRMQKFKTGGCAACRHCDCMYIYR